MNNFDPKKALIEEIQGLNEVQKAYSKLVSKFEQELAEAEVSLNATRQITAFIKAEIERKQSVLLEIVKKEKQMLI